MKRRLPPAEANSIASGEGWDSETRLLEEALLVERKAKEVLLGRSWVICG